MATSLIAGYYAELDILCIIILGLLITKTWDSNFISNQKKWFAIVLLCHIIFSASDLVWIFNNDFIPIMEIFPQRGVTISYMLNSLNVIASATTGFAWLVFSETVQRNVITQNRRKTVIYLLPLFLLVLLTLTTKQTQFMFHVSEQGEFFRGPGYAVQVLIAMGYVFIATFLSAKRVVVAKNLQEKKESRAIVGFITLPVCACVLQLMLPNMQVFFIGTVVALVSVYISLQQTQVLTDPLTGLNNRMLLDQKIENAIRCWDGEYSLYVMILDADNFKEINDKYGHVVGDKVLVQIANVLRKSCGATDYVCRYGGDEFVMLHHAPLDEDCTLLIQRIEDMLAVCDAPCPVSVSVGDCRYTPDIMSPDEFVSLADKKMYHIKSCKKEKRLKSKDERFPGSVEELEEKENLNCR